VLLVHNYYGSSAPSGENLAFELERDLLLRGAHEVRTFARHSDELRRPGGRGWVGALRGAAATPWNPRAAAALRREVAAFRPEVVHAHNTFPLLSPAIFPAVPAPAARVLTLHNYRLLCPAGIPARAAGTGRRHVEAFVALTGFQRDRMVAGGLPAGSVHVKPNYYPGSPALRPFGGRAGAVFVGRLSEEKGVRHLVEAWRAWGDEAPPLRVVGDGPLRAGLEAQARSAGGQITFLGQVPPEAAQAEIAAARLLVLPSVCFEGFPLVLREAFALGTPAAVSDLGPLPDLVEQGRAGLTFRAADPAALLEAVRAAWLEPGGLERRAAGARAAFEARYTEARNLELLLEIYRQAIAARAARGGA
jgi:glycosyltransferase involved in cell wall biosynthesis